MELATANAVFQSAMKIPAFVAKPILSCFLFLFACLLFLLIAPNLSKPAYAQAATGCNVNTTTAVTPGGTIEVYSWGMPTSTILVLQPNAHQLGTIPAGTSTNQFTIPTDKSVPLGTYNAVATFIANCTGGTDYVAGGFVGSGQVKVQGPLCSVGFSPNPVSPNGTLTVTLNGFGGDGFTAGIAGGWPPPNSQTGTFGSGGPLTFTAPASGGPFTVAATDTKWGNQCVTAPGSSNPLTIGTAGPSPTPTPPPGTGCPLTPTNTSWGTLPQPQVSGNNVTFDLSSNPPTGNFGIGVYDTSTGKLAKDSGLINGPNWSSSFSNGTYCAGVYAFVNIVSNVVTFTVPSGATGNTCSSSALMWVNDVRCRAIGGGWFDSDVFTLGQSAMSLESLNIILWGKSTQLPQVEQVTARKGALALTGNMVASLYSAPPASGVQYFAQKIHDLNPVTPAYAAAGGIGYQTLGPVQKIWIAFRNIAYVGFIIVFVIMGFMIMFRAHISPQAVATVQDSIPRLVIALILVTFSYAIAGFMIDIMFLILNIAIQALVSAKLINNADYIFNKNVFQVIWGSWKDIFGSVADAISTLIQNAISLPGFFGDLFGWAGGGLAALVIGIAVLFIMFRVFLMLLMAYIMIILLTMFAPFFFLIQALPGNNGAKEWFRQMASNIAVFPTVALMFILAGILGGIGALAPGATAAIQPDKIGQFPLIIGNLNAQAIGQLIGIGFLLITPSAADIVKNAFGGKGGGGGGMGNIGAAALAGAGAGMAVVGAAGRGAGGALITRGPIGGWRRASEAKRQDLAQQKGEAGIYNKEYRAWQKQLNANRDNKDQ